MNYAWEIALQAENQDVSLDDIQFVIAKQANPYLEVAFENLNQTQLYDNQVEVNLLYRYANIFSELMDMDVDDSFELRDILVNIIIHYLVQLDVRYGLSKNEYYRRFVLSDFLAGHHGERLKKGISSFAKQEQRYVSSSMLTLYQTGPSLQLLKRLLKLLYPKSIVYFLTDQKKQILIYIDRKQTEQLNLQIEFIKDMFIPFGFDVKIFWDKHFGIIGIAETMIPDEIMLF